MAYAILNGIRLHYDVAGNGDPVLLVAVVAGKDDIVTPPDFARALAKLIRRARLSVIPCGHWLILEQAETFNRALLRFLKGVRSK